jgi:hypothetical protein
MPSGIIRKAFNLVSTVTNLFFFVADERYPYLML